MQIPPELEAKVKTDAAEVEAKIDTTVAPLVAPELTLMQFVKEHQQVLIGAAVLLATVICTWILTRQ